MQPAYGGISEKRCHSMENTVWSIQRIGTTDANSSARHFLYMCVMDMFVVQFGIW